MKVLRTPEERFHPLPFFPWAPHYVEDLPGYQGLRLHYVDEGPRDAREVFLCLHGEPSWAYLYRKMIPVFLAAGARVVAPDWFGFGRSDKPAEDAVYTFSFHRDTALRLVERLDLRRITLVCQDWGGLLGLTLPMDMPERFARVLAMNTGIATGRAIGPGFAAWKAFAASYHQIPVAGLIALSSPGALNPYDAAAYDAPFPDASYQAGVRRFPQLVPVEPDMEGVAEGERARKFFANDWRGESFMAIGLRDPVLGKPAMEDLRGTLRGCPPPLELPEAGHFVQEWGDQVARAALAAWGLAREKA
jgi:haloalkane dehalogenase